MNYKQAIKLLSPYHAASLIWVNPGTESAPTGQLTTGLHTDPLLPVDNGTVCTDDLYTILDQHAKQNKPKPISKAHILQTV